MSGDSLSPVAILSPLSASSPGPGPGPVALAPRTPVSAVGHDAAPPAGVVTHKEWVVPPRPKPGRKPATDTPPTKRKAQNRAAQRAFRERRAARVNELEDKLKEVESDHTARAQDYQDQIQQLAADNTELVKENGHCKAKLESLQRELELVRQLKSGHQSTPASNFLTQVASPAPSSGHETPTCGINCACTDDLEKVLCTRATAPSVPIRRRSARNRSPSRPSSPDPLGCGRCSKTGNCACITEAAASIYPAANSSNNNNNNNNNNNGSNNLKRPTSPSSNTPKRTRTAPSVDLLSPDELETDFTTAYMTKPPVAPAFSENIARMPDPCGFCSDGTHCVCAEAAAAAAADKGMLMADDSDSEEHHSTRLPPLLSNHTPPPADSHAERLMALHPPMTKSAGQTARLSGCTPGGCKQCQNDPMSTLFCRSVAAKVGRPDGCCGGGCCDAKTPASRASSSTPLENEVNGADDQGTFIPASAAYQALSRHRGFEAATADLGSLMRPLMVKQAGGRCPLVEVSSVRDVLKQLDRRFGSDVN